MAPHPGFPGCFQGVIERLPVRLQVGVFRVSEVQIVAEPFECLRCLNRVSIQVPHPAGHNQRVARVLVEEFVRLYVKRVGGRVPDYLIDADDLVAGVVVSKRTPQVDQEDSLALHCCDIDGTTEGDGQPGLQIEAVERVNDVQVLAV